MFLFAHAPVDNDPATKGKKKVRKTTRAGGGEVDLAKIAAEQKAKLDKERDERMELAKQIKADMDAKAAGAPEPEPENKGEKEEPDPVEEKKEELGDEEIPVEKNKEPGDEEITVEKKKKRVRTGPLIPDTIIGKRFHGVQ
jgi:outer membrane biosynthesis protein TonB